MKRYFKNRYLNYWVVLCIDLIIALVSSIIAIVVVRHFSADDVVTKTDVMVMLATSLVVNIFCFYVFHTYRQIIRHSSLRGLAIIGTSVLLKSTIFLVLLHIIPTTPLNGYVIWLGVGLDMLISLTGLIGVRVLMILAYDWVVRHSYDKRRRVLVYGIGDKSVALMTRMFNSSHYYIVGFLTYGGKMKGYKISERKTYHFLNEENVEKVLELSGADTILFATDDDVKSEKERLIKYCAERKEGAIRVLVAPQVDEFQSDSLNKMKMRNIRIEDLLGRDEITINREEVYNNFHGKRVMVTGGAGSIGSEICRQMAELGVKKLIIFDMAETPLHEIRLELEHKYPDLDFVPVIGDVRSAKRLQFAFDSYKPEIVFHAAAYKHVPLMEENPSEAVLSNVHGSKNVADLCVKNNVEKMVMVSTDKAVNPTNVMGCSKRLAEIYCQSLGVAIQRGKQEGRTKFVTTRFGNVLGSNGSVIPHFRKQIEEGGPVTVTHPKINRFFMTIPEACRLVMEAATMSNGNEIFVFEMGEPVMIVDLAKRMIKLAGYVPGKDIEIKFTGLRAGEKLYEEVLSNEENTIPTNHKKIKIAKVREYDFESVANQYIGLIETAKCGEVFNLVRQMKCIVPEFKSNNSMFEELDRELEAQRRQANEV